MRIPNKLYKKSTFIDRKSLHDSEELPRFSFEDDDRPLVSTERLFDLWSGDEETAYDSGVDAIKNIFRSEQDVIVSSRCFFVHKHDQHSLQVTWDGPNDPANPLNWSQSRKWFVTMLGKSGN